MSPSRRPLALLAAAAALAGLTAGCQRKPAPAPAGEGARRSVPKVTVVRAQRQTVRRDIERPGYNVEPYQSTAMYAKIPGYVREWMVDIGATVQKGQILAVLDVPEMEVELAQRKAAVRQAEAEVRQAKAAAKRAQAEQRHAQSQYERLARVGQGGIIDKENVAEARYLAEAAEAGVDKAVADVDVANERLEVARKRRDYTETLLKYAEIRAPFKGVVTRRNVSTWDFVGPPNGQKGEALFVVDQVDPVRVVVNVPEAEAVWVRDGVPATIRGQGLRGRRFTGTVTRTARALHPASRTLRTEIQLRNPREELMPGTYVDVTIVVEHKNTWTLPPSAILTKDDHSFCYRVEGGKAILTPVRVGLRGMVELKGGKKAEFVEVLKKQTKPAKPGEKEVWEDLTGEEEIIKDGVADLQDGAVAEARAGLKRAQFSYDRWTSEAKRLTDLVENKTLQPQIREEAVYQAGAAESARDEARARIDTPWRWRARAAPGATRPRPTSPPPGRNGPSPPPTPAAWRRWSASRTSAPPSTAGSRIATLIPATTSSPPRAEASGSRCSPWPASTGCASSSWCPRPTPA